MDGYINHLHCHYRVYAERSAITQITSRLSRVLKDDLLPAYEEAMDKVFADDPSVIVIRKLKSRLAISLQDYPNDNQLAERWGNRMAGNVVRRIATAGEGDEDLIRFSDQAEYVACFITDLLDDRVAHRWYYGAFRYLNNYTKGETIFQVLSDNRQHIGKTLSLLHQRGMLERTFKELDAQMLKRLWNEAVRQHALVGSEFSGIVEGQEKSYSSPEQTQSVNLMNDEQASLTVAGADNGIRELFLQALNLLEQLSLVERSKINVTQLQQGLQAQVVVDWRDQQALSNAFCEILDYIFKQDLFIASTMKLNSANLLRLETALKDYDWLNIRQITTRFIELLHHATPVVPLTITPRQQALLATMLKVFHQHPQTLTDIVPVEALALQLYAQLIESQPQWQDDELASRLIDALAISHNALRQQQQSRQLRTLLRRGEVSAVMERLQHSSNNEKLRQSLSLVVGLGETAVDLLDMMSDTKPDWRAEQQLESSCAGVFLLLRAVADIRLVTLNETLPGLSFESLLLSFLMAVAGRDAVNDGCIDAGLSVLTTSPLELDTLRLAWMLVDGPQHENFQIAMLQTLVGQRLLDGKSLNIHLLETDQEHACLVAGDTEAQIWPLGCPVYSEDEIGPIIERWIVAWSQATGQVPAKLVIDEQLSTQCLNVLKVISGKENETDNAGSDPDSYSRHLNGREQLVQALKVSIPGHLQNPRADLQCALLAINVIRTWARWLSRFNKASVPYLLENMIRRTGTIFTYQEVIEIHLVSAPLDVVIEMAAYLNDLEQVAWLGRRTVKFRIGR